MPEHAPNSRYGAHLDVLELTVWVIDDFLHLANTDERVDTSLRAFNRDRRATIVLPEGW